MHSNFQIITKKWPTGVCWVLDFETNQRLQFKRYSHELGIIWILVKNWTKLCIQIYENRTYRAVKWCFTRSAILRSYIIYYSNKRYIFDCEFHRNVYDCTLMRKLPVIEIVLTIWFKNSSFFLYLLLHSGLSLEILIFFIFLSQRSECMWLARSNEWSSLRGFVMVGSIEFHGSCTCPNHFQPPQWTSLVEAGKSHAFRTLRQKKWKNIKFSRDSPEWSNK